MIDSKKREIMDTDKYKCMDEGRVFNSIHEANQHATETGHIVVPEGKENNINGGSTVSEATGIEDGTMGSGRGYGDAIEGAKDSMDDAEQNDEDPKI